MRNSRTGLATTSVEQTGRRGSRFTPAVSNTADEATECVVVNVSGAFRTVVVEVRDNTGAAVASSSCLSANPKIVFLAPGETALNVCSTATAAVRYCHFSVPGFPKTNIRGVLQILDDSTSATKATIAAE